MHSLASIMPYYIALSRGITPQALNLGDKNNKVYIQCLDPFEKNMAELLLSDNNRKF